MKDKTAYLSEMPSPTSKLLSFYFAMISLIALIKFLWLACGVLFQSSKILKETFQGKLLHSRNFSYEICDNKTIYPWPSINLCSHKLPKSNFNHLLKTLNAIIIATLAHLKKKKSREWKPFIWIVVSKHFL